MLRKQQARDRGEETCSYDDDDEEFNEVVADVDWDVLEGEDSLTGTQLSMRGPFPFHAGGSEPSRSVEMGLTISPSSGPMEAGGPTIALGVSVEGDGSDAAPHEPTGAGRSAATPEVTAERDGSTATPSGTREVSRSAQDQGVGSKWPCPDEVEPEAGG